jgi:hypothetical protein
MIGDYNKAFNKPQNLPPQPVKPGLKLNHQIQTLEQLQQQLDVIRNEIVGKSKPPKIKPKEQTPKMISPKIVS